MTTQDTRAEKTLRLSLADLATANWLMSWMPGAPGDMSRSCGEPLFFHLTVLQAL